MSAFTKNYYSPKDPNLFLSVSWETGYRNIQVYHGDRLVHTINQPAVLVDGIKIKDDELGTIKFRFTTVRPRKIEIKVNNKKFKTVNKRDLGYDYTGLIAMFTSLSVFALMETIIFGGIYSFDFYNPILLVLFVIGFLIAIAYGVTSYMLSKKMSRSYFVGTALFTLTTVAAATGYNYVLSDMANYMVLFIRVGMLIFMLLQAKHIMKEVKKSIGTNEEDGLLDG